MDQWEGQRFNVSPGNLYSEVQKVHLDPTKRIRHPPQPGESDSAGGGAPRTPKWVKHVKIQSSMLTKFWGHPIYIDASWCSCPTATTSILRRAIRWSTSRAILDLGAPFGFSNRRPDQSTPRSVRASMISTASLATSSTSRGFPTNIRA